MVAILIISLFINVVFVFINVVFVFINVVCSMSSFSSFLSSSSSSLSSSLSSLQRLYFSVETQSSLFFDTIVTCIEKAYFTSWKNESRLSHCTSHSFAHQCLPFPEEFFGVYSLRLSLGSAFLLLSRKSTFLNLCQTTRNGCNTQQLSCTLKRNLTRREPA